MENCTVEDVGAYNIIYITFFIYRVFCKYFLFPIDKYLFICYNSQAKHGRLAQLGEHLPYKQRVTGSSPVLSTIGKIKAQSSQRTYRLEVGAVVNDS